MTHDEIFELVKDEVKRAENKWPKYYSDVIHAAAIINEEAGETIQAALDYTYDSGSIEKVKTEAIQTAATCFRLLGNINDLKTVMNFVDQNKNGEQLTMDGYAGL